jgi:hypothetical protein
LASGFWYMAIFVKEHTSHPKFPRPYGPEYYQKAFMLIEELGSWLFFGSCPVLDGDKHFVI